MGSVPVSSRVPSRLGNKGQSGTQVQNTERRDFQLSFLPDHFFKALFSFLPKFQYFPRSCQKGKYDNVFCFLRHFLSPHSPYAFLPPFPLPSLLRQEIALILTRCCGQGFPLLQQQKTTVAAAQKKPQLQFVRIIFGLKSNVV